MAKTFKLEVVTPLGIFYDDEVTFISFKAVTGVMGVLAEHAPTLVAIKPGTLVIEKDNKKKNAFISEGFVNITKEKVSVDVDFAGWAGELNTEKIIRDQRIAEEELSNKNLDNEKITELKASIERSKAALITSSIRD